MSTHYTIALIAKIKGWESLAVKTAELNKEVLNGYELPIDFSLQPKHEAFRDTIRQHASYTSRSYKGVYDRTKLHDYTISKNKPDFFPKDTPESVAWIEESFIDQLKSLEEVPADFLTAVTVGSTCLKTDAIDGQVMWFDPDSWEEEVNRQFELFEEDLKGKAEWGYIQKTMEYMKSSPKEKGNIALEYSNYSGAYIDQYTHDVHYDAEYITSEEESRARLEATIGVNAFLHQLDFENVEYCEACVYCTSNGGEAL